MAHKTFIAIFALIAVSLPAAVVLFPSAQETYPISAPVDESAVMIDAENADQKITAEWGLGRFEAAGLQLPTLIIEFSTQGVDECDGAPARTYLNESPIVVKMCWNNRFMLLHELGHVWEALNVSAGKHEPFMAMRSDVTSWAGLDVEWVQRGREHAANVIAWGLLENPYPISRTYPNDPDSLCAAFQFLTGIDPLHDGGPGLQEPDRQFFSAERVNEPLESGR